MVQIKEHLKEQEHKGKNISKVSQKISIIYSLTVHKEINTVLTLVLTSQLSHAQLSQDTPD